MSYDTSFETGNQFGKKNVFETGRSFETETQFEAGNRFDAETQFGTGNSFETEFTGAPCGGLIHVIRPGDTLYRLSRLYHVRVEEIMYSNPYVDIYNLQPGDELCIPVGRV